MRREALVTVLVLGAILVVPPAAPTGGVTLEPWSSGMYAHTPLTGWLALPADPASATHLVIVAHGYGWTAADWKHHLTFMAEHGAIAIAVDYGNWEIGRGVRAIDSAYSDMQRRFPSATTTTVFGVSMGGAVSVSAIDHGWVCGLSFGCNIPSYEYWFDIEGVSNLAETYAEANLAAPVAPIAAQTVAEIDRECAGWPIILGGPAYCFYRYSGAFHAEQMAANGVKGVVVVHSVNDGLVPYNQGQEMVQALRAADIPTEFTTVLRGDAEPGTTLTGYAGQPAPAGLAGHASEVSTTHPVMRIALDRLAVLLDGGPAPMDESLVWDAGAETRV